MKNLFEPQALAELCSQYHIRKLSLFGSVLGGRDLPESDVDLLVEFEPAHIPSLFAMARIERELTNLLGGRRVDLRTPEDLSRYFRQTVINQAEVQFAA